MKRLTLALIAGIAAATPVSAHPAPFSYLDVSVMPERVEVAVVAHVFDVAHDFGGCIAGCHEVLRRQGILQGIWCLDPKEGLSPGQAAELSRVQRDYPHLVDDDFVKANLERWLA